MTEEQCWGYTPREFAAFEAVYDSFLHRWAFDKAFAASIAGAKRADGGQFTADDFINTRESAARKRQRERDEIEGRKFIRKDRENARLMKAGQFDESLLPEWARMSPQEKAARGIQ